MRNQTPITTTPALDLRCPSCSSEGTRKLSLAMNDGGQMNVMARVGGGYLTTFVLPIITIILAAGVGFFVAAAGGMLFGALGVGVGALCFVAICIAGFLVRRSIVRAMKPQYASLSRDVQQNGYVCNRCAQVFIPR